MNALLERLDAVQMDEVSMISEHDKAVCVQYQEELSRVVQFAEKYNQFLDVEGVCVENLHFQTPDRLKKKMDEEVEDAKNDFIDQLVWYFQRTYNVTIQSYDMKKKYDQTVTYQDIVREIVEQLGGLNFEEKAVQEIKDKLREDLSYAYSHQITRSKAKLTIGGRYMYWEAAWSGNGQYRPSGYDCSQQRHLFTALSHFERGATDMLNCFFYLCRHDDRSTWFDKDEFEYLNKVKATKFYKNGKVDIHFATPELAQQFAREYLNMEV